MSASPRHEHLLSPYPFVVAMVFLISCQAVGVIDARDGIVAATVLAALAFSVIFGARR